MLKVNEEINISLCVYLFLYLYVLISTLFLPFIIFTQSLLNLYDCAYLSLVGITHPHSRGDFSLDRKVTKRSLHFDSRANQYTASTTPIALQKAAARRRRSFYVRLCKFVLMTYTINSCEFFHTCPQSWAGRF